MLPSAGVEVAEPLAEQHGAGVALRELLVVDELEAVDLGGGRGRRRAALSRSQARAAVDRVARGGRASDAVGGEDRGRRAELVPAQVDRAEPGGRGALGGGRQRGAASVEVGEAGDRVGEGAEP